MSDQSALRDIILIEADFLSAHAVRLDQWAKNGEARAVLEKQMEVAAITIRQRAKILHEVLEATEPKAEAS